MRAKITSLGTSGEGVGTIDEGLVVFVEGALPGEEVEISLTTKKKKYAVAKLEKIYTPSKDRVKPICPLFGDCGGCHIMHLSYQAALEMKRRVVQDALQRIGHLKNISVANTLPSPKPLHYRNKIALPVTEDKMGLYRRASHDIIDVPKCYIHCERGEKIYHWIRTHLPRKNVRTLFIRSGCFTDESLVVIVTYGSIDLQPFAVKLQEHFPEVVGVVESINCSTGNALLGKQFCTLAGRDHFFEKILGKTFKITASSFFQINSYQAELLFQKAIELAEIRRDDIVYDAYTGVGTLALFAADFAKQVIGVECVSAAIESALFNAKLNQITNCHFSVGFAAPRKADITILNPPRKGCDPHFLQSITSRKIIYISCNPATLARDLQLLNRYTIETVQPIDLFPQTMHVETVVSLKSI